MSTKEKKRTGPGVSDPQGPAGVGGIVPAPSPSSSDVGLPSGFPESPGGEMAISVMAKGLAKALSAGRRSSAGGSARVSPESGPGAQASPAPATPGPSRSRAGDGDAVFKRPGPLSSKKKGGAPVVVVTSDDDSSSDDMSVSSDMSSDTRYALAHGGQERPKRGRGRPSTTGEWVGVEGVRQELALLKKEHERVVAERDVLAAKFEVSFGQTAGKIPSADDVMRGLTDETVDSLINIVFEEMEAVERVAERSGALKGTFKGLLRAASRRTLAASKLLFTRATIFAREEGVASALEQTRRELQAAKGLLEESQDRVRVLEGEVRVLEARETLRSARAERASPPPFRLGSPSFEAEVPEGRMEVEVSPARGSPPPTSMRGGPSTEPAPSLDIVVERVVERVLERLTPPREIRDPPPAPPRPTPASGGEKWSEVVGRRARGKKGGVAKASAKAKAKAPEKGGPPPPPPAPVTGGGGGRGRKKKKKAAAGEPGKKAPPQPTSKKKAKASTGLVREPRTGAVLVSLAPKAGTSMVEALRALRPCATEYLQGAGAKIASLKRAQAGGLLIQLAGEEGHRQADGLAAHLQQAAQRLPGVRVRRPLKRAELRLQGLDESISREEIIGAVTGQADCRAEDLAVGEIRFLPNRLGSVWLRCPVAASNKLVEAGRLRIGWATVVVKPLPARRMRCFQCLEVGHGAAECKGPDRSGRCHRCSDRSHRAQECSAGVLKCPLCSDFGLPAVHALGAPACIPSGRVARRKLARAANEKAGAKGGARSREGDAAPPAPGEGSKGGPRRAKPPETLAPAGPTGGERGTRPKSDRGPSSRTSQKGSTGDEGDRPGKSLKRTASDRSPIILRRREVRRDEGEGEEEKEESPPPPPPTMKKRRDQRGRSKSLD